MRFQKQNASSLPTGVKFHSKIKPTVSDLGVLYVESNLVNQKVLCEVLQRIGVWFRRFGRQWSKGCRYFQREEV